MGLSARAIKATAWTAVAVGVAAPVVRKRVKLPAVVVHAVAFGAPLGLTVALPRSKKRDAAVACLQMWAYVSAYKAPHDDEDGQRARVQIDYPIAVDRVIGMGELPTVRLQRALASRGEWTRVDRLLVWAHWVWFLVPHTALAWIMWRRYERFARAAVMMYTVFDVGAAIYWVLPTAPPWYAASVSRGEEFDGQLIEDPGRGGEQIVVRRMMAEYGEYFWRDGWGPLYSVFGGNPLAAMPSLHFATSLMAALQLAESGRVSGAIGWIYVGTLGFALVYLGEHYVVDLIAGAALTISVWRIGPRLAGPLARATAMLEALQARANPDGAG